MGQQADTRSRSRGRLFHAVLGAMLIAALIAGGAAAVAAKVHTGSASAQGAAGPDPQAVLAGESAVAAAASSSAAAAAAAASSASAAAAASASASAASVAAAASASAAAERAAQIKAVRALAAGRSASAISIAALNTTTGASYGFGATQGMATGSIVKLYILQTLLLQRQHNGGLSSTEQATATTMIENSDNGSAETLFEDIGGRAALIAANTTLGLKHTTPGPGDYWGLTTTSAGDYLTLLRNLVQPSGGPLTSASRAMVLELMRHVESDQRWGVGVTADRGTDFANKNGWLGLDDDGGLWLVDSVGVVTIKGQQVLMVVLTQHNSDFTTGVNLVQSLAKALAPLVVS